MKKTISLVTIILLFTMHICAYAKPCPMPSSNTNAEITFPGFEWYSDYSTVVKAARARGFDMKWQTDYFQEGLSLTPHWTFIYSSLTSFAGAEKGCGGVIHYFSVPDVAGYSVKQADLYMMKNPENVGETDYKQDDAVQLYMAVYSMDVADYDACYNDLVSKLESIYGVTPDKNIVENTWGNTLTYWVNEDGALLGINHAIGVNIFYMAPGAEEKLIAVEEKVRELELENAKGDISGL